MWIIQEPKKVALWNKRHFEEKNGEYAACLKYSVLIFDEKIYKMQHLEGSGTPVLYIGRTVLQSKRLRDKRDCNEYVKRNLFVCQPDVTISTAGCWQRLLATSYVCQCTDGEKAIMPFSSVFLAVFVDCRTIKRPQPQYGSSVCFVYSPSPTYAASESRNF